MTAELLAAIASPVIVFAIFPAIEHALARWRRRR